MAIKELLSYTTRISYATSKSKSLKTSFPQEISKILKAQAGDEIEWFVNIDEDELFVTVKKKSKEENIEEDS